MPAAPPTPIRPTYGGTIDPHLAAGRHLRPRAGRVAPGFARACRRSRTACRGTSTIRTMSPPG